MKAGARAKRVGPLAVGVACAAVLAGCYTELKGRPRPAHDRAMQRAAEWNAQASLEDNLRVAGHLVHDAHAPPPPPSAEPARKTPTSRVPRITAATLLAAGQRQTCAAGAEGVDCWGRTHDPAPTGPVSALSVGFPNACAADDRGAVRCWGENVYGALGDGTIDVRREPVRVRDLEDAVALGVGFYASCAVRRSGAVACWGRNQRGALGDGTETTHRTPTSVAGLPPVAEVAGGEDFFCARTQAGEVYCWGDGRLGQGGDGKMGDKAEKRRPTKVPGLTGIVSLAAGRHHVCAADGSGLVHCWGLGVSGVLGPRARAASGIPVELPDLDHVVQVACAETFGCARRQNGEVWCWGSVPGASSDGGAGIGKEARPLPGFLDAVQIAVGEGSVCARRAGGEITCTSR